MIDLNNDNYKWLPEEVSSYEDFLTFRLLNQLNIKSIKDIKPDKLYGPTNWTSFTGNFLIKCFAIAQNKSLALLYVTDKESNSWFNRYIDYIIHNTNKKEKEKC